MTFRVRRIRDDEGARLRDARLAALADQPRDATTTVALTEPLSDHHWDEAASVNASGGLQATFFAVVGGRRGSSGDEAAPGGDLGSDADAPSDGGVPSSGDLGSDADEAVVGLVGAYANQRGTVNIVGLWSAPGYRDVGVAEALLDAVRGWAVHHGHRRLRRWVVARNEHAVLFYERTGFRATGESMPYEPDPRLEQVETVLDL